MEPFTDFTAPQESSTAVSVSTQEFTQLSQPVNIIHVNTPKSSVILPIQDYSLLPQSAKSEPQKIVLTCSVKREECPSPIFRVGLQSEELPSVKSERLTPVSSPVNPNSVKSEDTSCSATSSPALTTELENFQDLTEWCRRAPKTPNMSFLAGTDELNTPPVLEFGEFMFTSPTTIDHTNDDCFGLLNVPGLSGSPELYNVGEDIQSNKFNDLECQIFGNDSTDNFNNIKSETYQYANVFIGGGEIQEDLKTKNVTYMNNYNLNNVFTKCIDTVHSGLNQQTSVSYDPKPNTNMQSSSTGFTSHETTEDILSFAPSSSFYGLQPEAAMNLQDLVSFPLESVVPQPVAEKKLLPRLDFSNIWVDSKQISTPEVINAALSLETGLDFNFITEENVVAEEVSASSVISPEEVEEDSHSHCPSTTNDPDPDPSYTPSEASDEDEEYEPPWKKQKIPSRSVALKQKKQKTRSPVQRLDLESEVSNASTVESVKVVRRGRPPKRNVSISSESNGDPDVSRYRELRDKNNEASRRSRQNRKRKEVQLEEEANDLDMRNRKLKVRVHELEKLVTTMRTNLMQMLLRK